MAIFRKVHTSIWSDAFFSDLDNDKKLFYIYLMTNERTKQCGVYEITKKQICFDLAYSMNTVSKLFEYFIKTGKVRYNDTTKEVAIGNWLKYNSSSSPKVQSCINREFAEVKDTLLIEYVKSMDTRPQEEQEEEQEEEREQERQKIIKNDLIDFEIFWDNYDKKTGDKIKISKKWYSLDLETQKIILNYIPKYKDSQPEKKFRKNPETFFNNKAWNDEIIGSSNNKTQTRMNHDSDKF